MNGEDEKDWKDLLAEDAQEILAELIEKSKRHKCAYCQAEDVKVAQLWSALVELKKEFNEIEATHAKLLEPFAAIAEVGEVEKRRAIERIVREMVRPEPEQEVATQKLVDSLMKF